MFAERDPQVAAEIRRVRPIEWHRLRDLRLSALADAPTAFASTVADEAAFPDATWQERAAAGAEGTDRVTLIAERGIQWLGLATGLANEPDDLDATLVGMFVIAQARRCGIATALVDEVARWARERRARRLHLWVTNANTGAIELYRRCGFRPTGQSRPFPRAPGLEEFRMVRDLVDG